MDSLIVKTGQNDYNITFNDNFSNLSKHISLVNKKYSKYAIITDDNVGPLYLDDIKSQIENISDEVHSYTFKHGEKNKNHTTIMDLYNFLVKNKIDRKSVLIALGGGVTGDMVGFVAATYMRGIDFIQIPTSLLSQVDSSIGGKTGIDFNGYKNIVGAFHQPKLVYINTSTLKTLPTKEFNSGMGEVIKHGLIKDSSYFNKLINSSDNIKELEHYALTNLIKTSCEIKAHVVSQDEKEHGLRAILNFGHTVGHAIERLKNFQVLHGECVAIGMIVAAYISKELGTLNSGDISQIIKALNIYNLPTSISLLTPDEIYNEMFHDKKTSNNIISFILLNKIGDNYIEKDIPKKLIINSIRKVATPQ
jgi:3-dehydroquinate synthase